MNIPVFHDDQHGTAIISSAALLNGLESPASGSRTFGRLLRAPALPASPAPRCSRPLGVRRENVLLVDSVGVVYDGPPREDEPVQGALRRRHRHADARRRDARAPTSSSASRPRTCSRPTMLLTMADDPIVFAMANPDPEIDYQLAIATRATSSWRRGVPTYPNQVNNVLGFPFIFRGALDVQATHHQRGDEACGGAGASPSWRRRTFPSGAGGVRPARPARSGATYLIPKPFDPRVLLRVAPAVARRRDGLRRGAPPDRRPRHAYRRAAGTHPRAVASSHAVRRPHCAAVGRRSRLVFADGEDDSVLRAVRAVVDQHIATPLLDRTPQRHRASRRWRMVCG